MTFSSNYQKRSDKIFFTQNKKVLFRPLEQDSEEKSHNANTCHLNIVQAHHDRELYSYMFRIDGELVFK